MNKDWMEDPTLSQIDRKKLEFLHTLVIESTALSQKDLFPFFLSLAKRGKEEKPEPPQAAYTCGDLYPAPGF